MSLKKIVYILIIIFFIILILHYNFNFLYVLIFLSIHELAHIFTAMYLGYTYEKLKLLPFGVSLTLKQEFIKPLDDLIISISGPLINFIFFILFTILELIFLKDFQIIKMINLGLFFFNIIPAGFLDGGRILRVIVSCHLSFRLGYILVNINGIILGCMLILLALNIGIYFKTIVTVLLGIFIVYTSIKDMRGLSIYVIKNMIYKQNYIYGQKSFIIKQRAFNADIKILEILKYLCFNKYYIFYIIDENGKTEYCFELDLVNSYCNYGNIKFKDCIRNIKWEE